MDLEATGAAGSQNASPGAGSDVTITNNGGDFDIQSSDAYVLEARSFRGTPIDAYAGRAGGTNTVTNDGDLTQSSSSSSLLYGINSVFTGGNADRDNQNNRSPGDKGGAGGTVSVTNSRAVTIGTSSAPLGAEGSITGILAQSIGGGGDTDPNVGDNDPASGNGSPTATP